MEKEVIAQMVAEGLTLREMSDRMVKSKTTIRYWLLKYDLQTKRRKRKGLSPEGVKYCNRCNQTKSVDEFYRRRNGLNTTPYCKPCSGKQTLDRQRALKKQCIEYKGGQCEKCAYSKCDSALEFHHIDPSKKDFSISSMKQTTFSSDVKKELDKCILVCSNCHREIHFELTEERRKQTHNGLC